MRSVTALEVRRSFGQILDEAAAGQRIVIERAGQPIAALVPLSDLAELDPDRRRAEKLKAIEEIARSARRPRGGRGFDVVQQIRRQRQERDDRILRAVNRAAERPPE